MGVSTRSWPHLLTRMHTRTDRYTLKWLPDQYGPTKPLWWRPLGPMDQHTHTHTPTDTDRWAGWGQAEQMTSSVSYDSAGRTGVPPYTAVSACSGCRKRLLSCSKQCAFAVSLSDGDSFSAEVSLDVDTHIHAHGAKRDTR